MLTNENLEARKPAADAPARNWYGYRAIEEFVRFQRRTGLNVTDIAKLFDINYQKLRSVLYGVPGTRVLVQSDLYQIHKIQDAKDFPHKDRINIFYMITGVKETPSERTWRAVAESRGRHLEQAQKKLDAFELMVEIKEKSTQ